MSLAPRPYQEVGRDFLAANPHALLADEMRVGKTPQAILAAQKLGARRILVTTQAIGTLQWCGEWQRWLGRPAVRLDARTNIGDITVCSYEMGLIRWQELVSQTWDVFIPDEAHFAGNPTAQRTAFVWGKTGVSWKSGAVWPLSGTPAPKTAASLWPMMRAFDKIKMEFSDFVRRFCTTRADGTPIGTKERHIPELRAILDTFMLRRKFKEVAPDVPEIDYQFLAVEPEARQDLAPLGGLSDAQIEAGLESHSEVDREDRRLVALAKVGPLSEHVDFALGNGLLKQTVVFGWHVDALKRLKSNLSARGYRVGLIIGEVPEGEREATKAGFRDGTVDVVVAQIRAAGTNIDLSAARHGFFLELDWVPGNNAQAAFRLMSVMEKSPVSMDVVTWPGSVDDRIQRILLRRVRELAKLY